MEKLQQEPRLSQPLLNTHLCALIFPLQVFVQQGSEGLQGGRKRKGTLTRIVCPSQIAPLITEPRPPTKAPPISHGFSSAVCPAPSCRS